MARSMTMASSIVLFGLLLISLPSSRAYNSVAEYAVTQPDLSTVLKLVGEAGLASALGPDFDGSVFLPTNAAFADIEKDLAKLTPEQVKDVLLYHALPDFIESASFRKNRVFDTLLEGFKVQLSKSGTTSKVNRAHVLSQRYIGKAKVFLIDKVLIPKEGARKLSKSVAEFAASRPDLSTIVKIATDLDLVGALGPDFRGTVFLPNDDAFEAIKDVADKLSEDQLKFIVKYHLAGRVLTSSDFDKTPVTTYSILGQALKLALVDKKLKVNNATCLELVPIGKGAACVVDQVLLPAPARPHRNVLEFVAATPELSTLLQLVTRYPDLVEALKDTDFVGSVFLPSNAAFEEIKDVLPKLSDAEIKDILLYHAVGTKTLRAYDFGSSTGTSDANQVEALNGDKLTLARQGTTRLTVNGKKVTDQGRAGYATVFLLDHVLLPAKEETTPEDPKP